MPFSRIAACLTLFSVFTVSAAHAQIWCAKGWTSPVATNVYVGTQTIMPNGDVLMGGSFHQIGTTFTNNVVRYRPSTGEWWPLGSGIAGIGYVYAIAVLPDGDVVAGGIIFGSNNALTNYIARYNQTTRIWSPLGMDPDGPVNAMAVLPSGDLIVGGQFSHVGGLPAANIARYNPTTGAWSAIGSGITGGAVKALLALPGGDFVAGGTFTAAGGVAVSRIARCNPQSNAWSNVGTGLSDVSGLALLPGGDFVAGGMWGISRYRLSTSAWSSVTTSLPGISISLLPDGDIVASGGNLVGRVNPNTGVVSFFPAPVDGPSDKFESVVAMNSGEISIGGAFEWLIGNNVIGYDTIGYLARYNLSTGAWSNFGSAPRGRPFALATLPNGDVAVGGTNLTPEQPNGGVAIYHARSGRLSGLGALTGRAGGANRIAQLPNGDIIVIGSFTSAGGVAANNIARLNAGTGVWSPLGSGVNGNANFIAVLHDGDIMVTGSFTTAGGVAISNRIARWNMNTGVWSAVNIPAAGNCMLVEPDGNVIVADGRYNPSTGIWTPLPGTPPRGVMALLPDGDIVATDNIGLFNNIARYNPKTGVWSDMNGGTNQPVTALTTLPGGDLLALGFFNRAGAVYTDGIARYNPRTNTWSKMDSSSGEPTGNDGIWCAAALPNGNVVVGGSFAYSDNWRSYSNFFQYSVGAEPQVAVQPLAPALCTGGTATLAITAFGDAGFFYQWRKNGVSIDTAANPSAATATLTLTSIKGSDNANYTCLVSSVCESKLSDPLTLNICASDLTCDGVVDDADFSLFVVQYNILDCADPSMPSNCIADVNGDGIVDDADFSAFVVAYNQLLCS